MNYLYSLFFFLILLRADEPERVSGILYIALYTLTASVPFFLFILNLVTNNNTFFISNLQIIGAGSFYISVIFIWLPFLVKLPVFGVHRWLPIAHVYSPVVGSIILAGVMLKVGAYGLHLIRQILILPSNPLVWIISSMALLGGRYAAASGLIQRDIKAIVAFSSITHISVICLLILRADKLRYFALVCICISHGIVRPLLFRLVDAIATRTGTRNLNYNISIKEKLIIISWFFFIALALNLGFPPRINFIGEATVFIIILNFSPVSLIGLLLLFLIRGIYRAWLWCTSNSYSTRSKITPILAHHSDYFILFQNLFLVVTSSILFANKTLYRTNNYCCITNNNYLILFKIPFNLSYNRDNFIFFCLLLLTWHFFNLIYWVSIRFFRLQNLIGYYNFSRFILWCAIIYFIRPHRLIKFVPIHLLVYSSFFLSCTLSYRKGRIIHKNYPFVNYQ